MMAGSRRKAAREAAGKITGKLEWSAELGRMVIRRDDGDVLDVAFGQFAHEGRMAEWAERERWGGW